MTPPRLPGTLPDLLTPGRADTLQAKRTMSLPVNKFNEVPRAAACLLLFGLSLSVLGYRSLEGDQAYRLPLLLRQLDASLYQQDPFVRSFDQFNPHQGYLDLLAAAARPAGLGVGLFAVYALTFCLTFLGIDRLARSVFPALGAGVGSLALLMVLITQAGNIGTNHLFGPMLLDRLIALALGWCALAACVASPARGFWLAPLLIVGAAWVHPALGLQLGVLLTGSWVAWLVLSAWVEVNRRHALLAIIALSLALLPTLVTLPAQSSALLEGLPQQDYKLLAAYVQNPQHLVPSLWRLPQWLAWFAFPLLAGICFVSGATCPRQEPSLPPARRRLALALVVNLLGLALSWILVEPLDNFRVMLFQPFRLATVARGLCIIVLSGHLLTLWKKRDLASRARVLILIVGLTGDWSFVVAACAEMAFQVFDRCYSPKAGAFAGLAAFVCGLVFLSRHDTASGHVPLLAAWSTAVALSAFLRFRDQSAPSIGWTPRRLALAISLSWVVPTLALLAPLTASRFPALAKPALALATHCRFAETPRDDVEALALWARRNLPADARFIGPPGPKTFRLWSRRDLAFNRASSPYHARGLADWAARFRAHVGFEGTGAEFATAYLDNRQKLEQGFDTMPDDQLAALAHAQQARFILSRHRNGPSSKLTLVKEAGHYAIYTVDLGPTASAAALAATPQDPPSSSRR